jgi:hypothetical protein
VRYRDQCIEKEEVTKVRDRVIIEGACMLVALLFAIFADLLKVKAIVESAHGHAAIN